MVDKIKDGSPSGGIYPDGNLEPVVYRDLSRLGVTGKINELIDEVGQIENLTTTNKLSLVAALNELKIRADDSLNKNLPNTMQTIKGALTLGEVVGQGIETIVNHNVKFNGDVIFTNASGSTSFASNYINVGSKINQNVGSGGIIFDRGVNSSNQSLGDVRLLWDEDNDTWRLRYIGDTTNYTIYSEYNVSSQLRNMMTNVSPVMNLSFAGASIISNSSGTSSGVVTNFHDGRSGLTNLTATPKIAFTYGNNLQLGNVGYSGTGSNDLTFTSTTGQTFTTPLASDFTFTGGNIIVNGSGKGVVTNSILESTVGNGVRLDGLKTLGSKLGANGTSTTNIQLSSSETILNPDFATQTLRVKGATSLGANVDTVLIDPSTGTATFNYNLTAVGGLLTNSLTQRTSGGINVNSTLNILSGAQVSATTNPNIEFNRTSGATDTKIWRIQGGDTSDTTFKIMTANDAKSSFVTAYEITRGTTQSSAHRMYNNNTVSFDLSLHTLSIGNVAGTSDMVFTKRGGSGRLIQDRFLSNNNVRGMIEYNPTSDRLTISKHNSTGVLQNSIVISDNDVSLSKVLTLTGGLNVSAITSTVDSIETITGSKVLNTTNGLQITGTGNNLLTIRETDATSAAVSTTGIKFESSNGISGTVNNLGTISYVGGNLTYDSIGTHTFKQAVSVENSLSVLTNLTAQVSVITDTISERTSGNGVHIDGIRLRDNSVRVISPDTTKRAFFGVDNTGLFLSYETSASSVLNTLRVEDGKIITADGNFEGKTVTLTDSANGLISLDFKRSGITQRNGFIQYQASTDSGNGSVEIGKHTHSGTYAGGITIYDGGITLSRDVTARYITLSNTANRGNDNVLGTVFSDTGPAGSLYTQSVQGYFQYERDSIAGGQIALVKKQRNSTNTSNYLVMRDDTNEFGKDVFVGSEKLWRNSTSSWVAGAHNSGQGAYVYSSLTLPNGFTLKTGYVFNNGTYTFPVAFATTCLSVAFGLSEGDGVPRLGTLSRTGFTYDSALQANSNAYFIAIGY